MYQMQEGMLVLFVEWQDKMMNVFVLVVIGMEGVSFVIMCEWLLWGMKFVEYVLSEIWKVVKQVLDYVEVVNEDVMVFGCVVYVYEFIWMNNQVFIYQWLMMVEYGQVVLMFIFIVFGMLSDIQCE